LRKKREFFEEENIKKSVTFAGGKKNFYTT
jgi:hypothetical protein